MSFPNRRIREIGQNLADFALEFVRVDADLNAHDSEYFVMIFDAWFDKFLRYAETNNLITAEEATLILDDPNCLDDFIKDAAIVAARQILHNGLKSEQAEP